MLRLTLFGGFSAAGADGAKVPLKSQKAKALLAYLSLPPGKPRSREQIMALLWSERGDAQARASLRQVLTGLRKELGEEAMAALIITDDAISLDPDKVTVAAANAGEELLAGFHLHDPAFEEWLRDERLRLEVTAAPEIQRPGPSMPDKPSIAVLPFANMSADPEQEFFSDGITEDIITELSRYRELFVIARNSSFSYKGQSPKVQDVGRELGVGYVVEGSVRKAGNRIRVTAQLIEARTGTHIWAERFDRDLEDIFAVQDEVTQAIVAVLPVRLDGAALERAKRKPVESLTAYEHFLRARWRWTQKSGDIEHAIEGIEMAIKLDPGFARAYAWLAIVYADSVFALSKSLDEPAEKARFFAEKAIEADDQDAYVHASAAIAYSTCGDFDQAKRHVDRAIALNPNEYMAIYARGMELSYGGDPEAGLAWYQKASRLDPQASDFYLESFIECHYMRRAYQDAVNFFNQWQNPPFYMYSVLAACHAQLGNMAEAAAAVETSLAGRPSIHDLKVRTAAHLRMCKRQEDREHWLEGYRKAGFDV